LPETALLCLSLLPPPTHETGRRQDIFGRALTTRRGQGAGVEVLMTALLAAQGLLAASSRQETAKLQLELNAKVAELGSKGAEVKKLQVRHALASNA